jgi:hypothetical protein
VRCWNRRCLHRRCLHSRRSHWRSCDIEARHNFNWLRKEKENWVIFSSFLRVWRSSIYTFLNCGLDCRRMKNENKTSDFGAEAVSTQMRPLLLYIRYSNPTSNYSFYCNCRSVSSLICLQSVSEENKEQ